MFRFRQLFSSLTCALALVIPSANSEDLAQKTKQHQYLFGQATFPGPFGAIASGDFNKDGKTDFVGGASGNTVDVILGNPDGTFAAPVSYAIGGSPGPIAVGDFNNDGNLDVVVTFGNYTSDCCFGLSVLLGNGDGTFAKHVDFTLGEIPSAIVTGDFNGDGHLDAAVLLETSVAVLLGNGKGSFAPPVRSAASQGALGMVVADFNGDGKLDIATAMYKQIDVIGNVDSLSILFGNGNGTFAAPKEISLETGNVLPFGIGLGDFNGDGIPDIAFGSMFGPGNNVIVFTGDGKGDFTFSPPYVCGSPISNDNGLIVTDLNGDGKLDVACYGSNAVGVLLGNGEGAFGTYKTFGIGQGGGSAVAADINGDNKQDLIFSAVGGVNVVLGNGDGTFSQFTDYPTNSGTLGLASADLNGDGFPDLVVANSDQNSITVYLNNGNGAYTAGKTFPTGYRPDWIASGDFNKDGHLDLAVTNMTSNTVSILLGNGDGTFQPLRKDYATGKSPSQVIVGDFNNDGDLDVAVVNSAPATGPGTVSVLLGKGDGTLETQKTTPLPFNQPVTLTAADFNADGKLDLVVGYNTAPSVTVLSGNGDGTFDLLNSYSLPSPGNSIVSGVFGSNGDVDLAVGSNTITTLLGQGNGSFTVGITYTAASNTLAVADFHHDGILNVLGAGSTNPPETASILVGNGDGTFGGILNIAANFEPSGISVADLNGDGSPDFAFVQDSTLTVYLSTPVAAIDIAATVVTGTTTYKFLLLSNPSPVVLTGITPTVSGSATISNGCARRLAGGTNCPIVIGYRTGSLVTLSLSDSAPGSPQLIPFH